MRKQDDEVGGGAGDKAGQKVCKENPCRGGEPADADLVRAGGRREQAEQGLRTGRVALLLGDNGGEGHAGGGVAHGGRGGKASDCA